MQWELRILWKKYRPDWHTDNVIPIYNLICQWGYNSEKGPLQSVLFIWLPFFLKEIPDKKIFYETPIESCGKLTCIMALAAFLVSSWADTILIETI